jgi:putative addiction module component (TIGR02574 family)
MAKTIETALAQALKLGVEERVELAAELLTSLDGPADPDAGAAWEAEIERRVAAIEAGTVELEPWEHVRRRIERTILGR